MRKYHNHNRVAVWGGSVPMRVRLAPPRPLPIVQCKHFSTKADVTASFWEGMRSLDLFPGHIQIIDCFEKDGLKADWLRVGSDLKVGMQLWSAAPQGPDKEVEAA